MTTTDTNTTNQTISITNNNNDELRNAVLSRLDTKGVLSTMKAQMRKELYEDLIASPPVPLSSSKQQQQQPVDKTTHQIVRSYLESHGARFTLNILDKELVVESTALTSSSPIENQNLPPLETIIHEWIEYRKSTPNNKSVVDES
jgi:hypothetical protein